MKRHQDYVLDREGNAVAGAEVYVRKQSDSTLVQLYSDNGVTTKANPTTTDNDGEFFFYTADNDLKLEVFVEGVEQQEVTHFQHYDLSVISTFGFSLIDDANAGAALTTLGVSAFAQTILDDANAGAARTTLGIGTGAVLDEATVAHYRANTADKVLTTDIVWGSADYVVLTPGTNVATDMSAGFNFSLAMGGNYTLDNPTNTKNGQTGAIVFTQDGTGSRTLAYGANWKFAGGADPVLSTAASAVDVLFYQVISSSLIYGTLVKALA